MTTRIWVDFNSLDAVGLYPTLRKFASLAVDIGDRVVGYDDDGNEAEGIVAAIDGDVVRLQLDLGTFSDERQMADNVQ